MNSIQWGDEADRETITLDDASFSVGKNLWNALRYLRAQAGATLYWMDALCINQSDTPERNRQLLMMRHIYFRASQVVVWLGDRYSRYQEDVSLPGDLPTTPSSGGGDKDVLSTGNFMRLVTSEHAKEWKEMSKMLYVDAYWNRLWIIQEVMQARRLKVCFGRLALPWKSFIYLVTMHNGEGGGPLSLEKQLQEKEEGGHTLRRLLENHQSALCKEPRDKIYGLVGLAADASGFPMDYNKSLLEIWTDVMEFMNRRKLLPESDIVHVAGLVKSLLMGNRSEPLQQVLRPYEPDDEQAYILADNDGHQLEEDPKVFKLESYILGYVTYVGPSTSEIVAELNKVDEWAEHVQLNYRNELDDATKESNTLVRAIIDSDEARLAQLCFGHVSRVRWHAWPHDDRTLTDYSKRIQVIRRKAKGTPRQFPEEEKKVGSAPGAVRLYQLENLNRRVKLPRMGVAFPQVQLGDIICYIPGVKRVAVVRHMDSYKASIPMQVFGTAQITANVASAQPSHPQLPKSGMQESVTLQMDAETIFVLLAEDGREEAPETSESSDGQWK